MGTDDDPVPEHTLFPPGRGLDYEDMQQIQQKFDVVARKTKNKIVINTNHILMRGLRRGIGIYNTELPSSYLQIVQEYAQNGRLGIVFSDEALAYGVNMPFRTSAFIGDPGPEVLDALLAQQASGRAGRRGMDRQGNLAYIGISWSRIQHLMRGLLPEIVGRETAYPCMALAQEVKTLSETKVTDDKLDRLASLTLNKFVAGSSNTGYFQQSQVWMKALNLSMLVTNGNQEMPSWRREMVWLMRAYPAESLVMEQLLDEMETEFEIADRNYVKYEDRFFFLCCMIVDRTTHEEGKRLYSSDEPRPPLSTYMPDHWATWAAKIQRVQDALCDGALKLDNGTTTAAEYEECRQGMLLRGSVATELDATSFKIFQTNGSMLNTLGSLERQIARRRLYRVGEVIRIMSNSLGRSIQHPTMIFLFYRAFLRCRYIMFESFSDLFKTSSELAAKAPMNSSYQTDDDYDDDDFDEEMDKEDNSGTDESKAPEAPAAPAEPMAAPTVEAVEAVTEQMDATMTVGTSESPSKQVKAEKKKKKKKKAVYNAYA
jgi:hypothetical protein